MLPEFDCVIDHFGCPDGLRISSRDVNTSKSSRAVSEKGFLRLPCPASFPLSPVRQRALIMVTTPSIAADYDAKRQRLTLEKAKVVTVSI
jgi:hypothetical protein